MKCQNCGAKLIRIAFDCYKCPLCRLKHKAGLMAIETSTPNETRNFEINLGNQNMTSKDYQESMNWCIDKIENSIKENIERQKQFNWRR